MAKFWFKCIELDHRNWVVNFGGLKDLKQILQKQFDHTLCIAADDPLLATFRALHEQGGCDLRIMDGVGIEKTAEWCFRAAQLFLDCNEETRHRCFVTKVEVWEHEQNSAIYTE
jgi:6-pyruvoyltetrahydropterin/6-carboxytetrahydropterin synthase